MQPVYPAPTDRDTFAPDVPISASGSLLEPGRDVEPSRESAAESKPKTAAEMMLAGMAGGGYQQKLLEKKRQKEEEMRRMRDQEDEEEQRREEEKRHWEEQRAQKHANPNVTSSFISVSEQMAKPVIQNKAPPKKKVNFEAFGGSSDDEADNNSFLKGKPQGLKTIEPIQKPQGPSLTQQLAEASLRNSNFN